MEASTEVQDDNEKVLIAWGEFFAKFFSLLREKYVELKKAAIVAVNKGRLSEAELFLSRAKRVSVISGGIKIELGTFDHILGELLDGNIITGTEQTVLLDIIYPPTIPDKTDSDDKNTGD